MPRAICLQEAGEESGGPDRTAAIAGKAARRFHADPFANPKAGARDEAPPADAEFAVPLPAVVVENARQDTRKTEFTPSLIAAAQEMRTPPRPEPVAPRPADVPTLAAEPGTAAFREGFAERVTILTRGGLTEAEITLHPADLGPIDVRIRIEDGAATFRFDTPLAETRRAIEESLPRLAEMLEGNGLSLGDTQVGHPGHDGSEPAPFARRPGLGRETPDGEDEAPPPPVRRVTVAAPGRVDLFA
ncbi:MAG: flagellar hook-length control protein FliK [Betaproteobacteria bacterium]|nr:flagellar hook-length control protein FliK [Betaproteobacteria bacterium]